jgi:hypothetical protein
MTLREVIFLSIQWVQKLHEVMEAVVVASAVFCFHGVQQTSLV